MDDSSITKDKNTTKVKLNSLLYTFNEKLLHINTKDLKSKNTLYTFSYDKYDNLISISDKFNNKTTFKKLNNTIIITTPAKKEFILNIDTNNNITSIKYPNGSIQRFIYNDKNQITQKIDKNLNIYNYEYKNSKIHKVIDPENALWEFMDNKTLKPENDGLFYTNEYKNKALISKLKNQEDLLFTKTTDLKTNSVIYEQCGVKTQLFYKKQKDFYTNKSLAYKTIITTPNSLKKIIKHKRVYEKQNDTLNRQIDIKTINNKISKTIIDFKNHKQTIISPSGKSSEIYLDKTNTLIKKIKSPKAYDILYSYDDKGRVIKVSQGVRFNKYNYDENSNLKSIFNFPSLRKTSYFYDKSNRVIKQIFPDHKQAFFKYDNNDNLLSITTSKGDIHNFTYDKVNNLSTKQTPLNGQTIYEYDKQRRLKRIIKPDSQTIDYHYKNEKLQSIITQQNQINYTYDCKNLKSISLDNESEEYEYDGDLLTSIITNGTLNKNINFTYNNDFLISSIDYANIKEDISYNEDNEPKTIGKLNITRDKATNQIINLRDDNNYNLNYSYNLHKELTSKHSTPYTINIQRVYCHHLSRQYLKNLSYTYNL